MFDFSYDPEMWCLCVYTCWYNFCSSPYVVFSNMEAYRVNKFMLIIWHSFMLLLSASVFTVHHKLARQLMPLVFDLTAAAATTAVRINQNCVNKWNIFPNGRRESSCRDEVCKREKHVSIKQGESSADGAGAPCTEAAVFVDSRSQHDSHFSSLRFSFFLSICPI